MGNYGNILRCVQLLLTWRLRDIQLSISFMTIIIRFSFWFPLVWFLIICLNLKICFRNVLDTYELEIMPLTILFNLINVKNAPLNTQNHRVKNKTTLPSSCSLFHLATTENIWQSCDRATPHVWYRQPIFPWMCPAVSEEVFIKMRLRVGANLHLSKLSVNKSGSWSQPLS